jgi:hypothetical protein
MGMDNKSKGKPERKFNAYNKAWAQITYWFIWHYFIIYEETTNQCTTKSGIRTP